MRKLLLFWILGISTSCFAQDLSMDEFLSFSSFSSRKLENYIVRKGFRPAGTILQQDTVIDTWQQFVAPKDSLSQPCIRRFARYQSGKDLSFSLQTSSREEYMRALGYFRQQGFACGKDSVNTEDTLLFQKKNITIQAHPFSEEATTHYSILFQYKSLPANRSIQFGNDLLQFTSHEYLASFFGEQNVQKDVFYFSEKEISKCSVLFPKTPRQAVFIWKDQENLTGLSHIVLGGNVRTEGLSGFNQQIRENTWILDNGIQYNMRLDQLMQLNKEDISFYGRNSEYFMMVLPQNKGELNFSNVGIVLDCINCQGDPALDRQVVKASEALDMDLRLHVGMIILMPETH